MTKMNMIVEIMIGGDDDDGDGDDGNGDGDDDDDGNNCGDDVSRRSGSRSTE